ncbi:LAETG motif-containing sortase-dependent surface protein [Streptomyces sp. NPDC047841]|uniref:LAETG motif-containing sortase-dependent surface protein n=1 Tax=Streptomyces sp. NPDC047841 TaxID=3154708 RepID=UPI0034560097
MPAYAGWIDKTMKTNGAPSPKAQGSDLTETGTNDRTAAVAGVPAALLAAGGGTALVIRRRKTRQAT